MPPISLRHAIMAFRHGAMLPLMMARIDFRCLRLLPLMR